MLVDTVTITVKAGNGGNGAVHFRRNAQTAKGGPDGGNGGNGGSVYTQGIDDILGLAQFRYKKHIESETGVSGGRQNLFGRNGKDTVIRIPLGTQVKNEQTGESFEITDTTSKILLAKGGTGGRGNNEFKTAVDQAPYFAEKGTQGQEKKLTLALSLIADIGFIGLPNAGKSSLLKELTHAQPKIGDYPFTTLEPIIGMLGKVTLADIPGLIAGASGGKGLGIQFLRHIMKTKLLLHCIDITSLDIQKSYQTIREELGKYNEAMLTKPEVILLTKTDEVSEKELKEKIKIAKKIKKDVLTVSVFDEKSLDILKDFLHGFVKEHKS